MQRLPHGVGARIVIVPENLGRHAFFFQLARASDGAALSPLVSRTYRVPAIVGRPDEVDLNPHRTRSLATSV